MTLYNETYRIETARAQWDSYATGCYFVTICTHGKRHYFGEISHDATFSPSLIGTIATDALNSITSHYPETTIHASVVMPNHIHILLSIDRSKHTLAHIIGSFKSAVTRRCNRLSLNFRWQTRFHDHIIRDSGAFIHIQHYILTNPENWANDSLR